MKKYALLIGILFSLNSCNDFLELNPKTSISEEEYFANEEEIYKGLAVPTTNCKLGTITATTM